MNTYFNEMKLINTVGKEEPVQVEVNQEGCFTSIKLHYQGTEPTCVARVTMGKVKHGLPGDTALYAESYNMLSQTEGTLACPKQITHYTDAGHYKLPTEEGYFTAYNMMVLFTKPYQLIAYSSSKRFVGKIHFNGEELMLEQDLGNIVIEPGEVLMLEEVMICEDEDREKLLECLGERLGQHHQRLMFDPIPTGWCSWYYYGPDVTGKDIQDNMEVIKEQAPELKYIQIDDGYQAYMGDYLTPAPSFSHLLELIEQIKEDGLEPAIWVAPFIAEADSALFREHPEYFVKDEKGHPLSSDQVSFGGWRRGPWYMVDATHPGARAHLREVFRVMNQEWGIKYFKLDANMWGAMPFGIHFDPRKTYVEAYRMGMEAILEGAGSESYILGCNAPMWPSIGVVHGMRTTGDIYRRWDVFDVLAKECFCRNWQHQRLWINDPDCVVLANVDQVLIGPDGEERGTGSQITEAEFAYHRAHILASGGAVLSGDALTEIGPEHMAQLKRFLPLPDQAARFDDHTFVIGRQTRGDEHIVSIFNREEEEKVVHVDLRGQYQVTDFWDDTSYGEQLSEVSLTLAPHRAIVLKCKAIHVKA